MTISRFLKSVINIRPSQNNTNSFQYVKDNSCKSVSSQEVGGRDKKWRKIQQGQREGKGSMGSGQTIDFAPGHKEVQSAALFASWDT